MKRLLIEQDDENQRISFSKEGELDSEEITVLLLVVMARELMKGGLDELSAWDKVVEISKDGREAVAMMDGGENKRLN